MTGVSLFCRSTVLMMFFVASGLPAAVIDTAAEVAVIENAAQERIKAVMEPRAKLDAQFKAAMRKLEAQARADGDAAGELAAIRAVNEVEAGTLNPGKVEHPAVARVAKVHAEESRRLMEVASPGLMEARARRLAALRKLAARLKDAGIYLDAKEVASMIAKAEEEAKSPPLSEVTVFRELPVSMRFRGGKERLLMVQEAGGAVESEEAVLRGLRWLKETQNEDGSWTGANQCAMTGLALLALLGHGESPNSAEFGETCIKGIRYLMNRSVAKDGVMASAGEMNHLPYEHAIATQALAEALILCESESLLVPGLRETVHKAGQFIVSNQHESGGWDYGYIEDGARGGDLSVTSWQIGALKACKHTGLDFKNMAKCIRKALEYVEARQGSNGGFGYAGKGDSHAPNGYHTLTGAGVFCLQQWDKKSSQTAQLGLSYLDSKSRFNFDDEDCDLYGLYYEALAIRQDGGKGGGKWQLFQTRVMPQLIASQNPDGSWKAPGGGKKPNAVAPLFTTNAHYRNCLCILILESYYRFVPE